jgi:hypothetical protein
MVPETLSRKYSTQNRADGVAQVGTSKCKVLSLNPSTKIIKRRRTMNILDTMIFFTVWDSLL